MPKQKQRSVFWVVSTHVLTTGFAMPAVAALVAGAVIFAMQPTSLVSFLILLAFQSVGYIGGVFYSLSYIRKVAIIENPVACTKASIMTFIVLAVIGLGANLFVQFDRGGNNENPFAAAIALLAFYAVIGVAFAKITSHGFSQMQPETSDTRARSPSDGVVNR